MAEFREGSSQQAIAALGGPCSHSADNVLQVHRKVGALGASWHGWAGPLGTEWSLDLKVLEETADTYRRGSECSVTFQRQKRKKSDDDSIWGRQVKRQRQQF